MPTSVPSALLKEETRVVSVPSYTGKAVLIVVVGDKEMELNSKRPHQIMQGPFHQKYACIT